MKLFHKDRGEHPPNDNDGAAPTTQCEHVTLIPRWDNAQDMGKTDKVSLYRCEACGAEFTLAEADRLRETEEARLRRKIAS